MYTLISSIVKEKKNKKWVSMDLSSTPVKDILSTYYKVKLLVQDEVMVEPEVMDIDQLRLEFSDYSDTLPNLFIEIGNRALVTTTGSLDFSTKSAKYADAVRAGFKLYPVTASGQPDEVSHKEDRTWLLLKKNNFDYELFQNHCLLTINGFFHFTETNNQGIYVKDAMKSNYHCGENTCGIISFKDVCTLKTKLITEEMIKTFDGLNLSDKLIIDIGEDVSNKTIMISIGGYLVKPNSRVFSRVSENSILIDFKNYSLYNRFFESRQYLDYSGYEFDIPESNKQQYFTDELYSDEFIKFLLMMSQSFIVILDDPDIYFEEHNVRKSRMPGIYTSYVKPVYPMFVGQGMFANYWYTKQKPYWSLNVIDGFRHRRNFNTTKTKILDSIDDKRIPGNPINWSRGYYLKICKDDLVL